MPVLPADVRLKLYAETMQIRSQRGWGYRRISRALREEHGIQVSEGTVQNWIRGIHNPIMRLHRYFEPVASPELSYVIGIVLGDGYTIVDQGRIIVGLTNKDKHLLRIFCRSIAKILKTPSAGRIVKGTQYGTLKATVGSTLLGLFLRKPLNELIPFIVQYPAKFVSGFFDAEGCVGVGADRESLSVNLSASNTDVTILQLIRGLLNEKFGIASSIHVGRIPQGISLVHGEKVRFKKTVFVLRISKRQDVVEFARKIGFASIRKQRRLEDILSILQHYGPKEGRHEWTRFYSKVGDRWVRNDDGGPGEN